MGGAKKHTKASVLLFVVEGGSDHKALEPPIDFLIGEYHLDLKVAFCECRGDKTSDHNISTNELLKQLDEEVDRYLENSPQYYTFDDIAAIIYLCDTDGAFIPEEDCHSYDAEHPRGKKGGFLYTPFGIYADKAQMIIERNRHKKQNMEKLLSSRPRTKKVRHGAVPETHTARRQVYYFSANLDHFLHDDRNLDSGKKIDWAVQFSREPDKALRRLRDHATCVNAQALEDEGLLPRGADCDDKRLYDLSWEYIKRGRNSIKRHTNLNLLLDILEKASGPSGEPQDGQDPT